MSQLSSTLKRYTESARYTDAPFTKSSYGTYTPSSYGTNLAASFLEKEKFGFKPSPPTSDLTRPRTYAPSVRESQISGVEGAAAQTGDRGPGPSSCQDSPCDLASPKWAAPTWTPGPWALASADWPVCPSTKAGQMYQGQRGARRAPRPR